MFKRLFELGKQMTRPAEYTRNLIIKAAVSLFAEKGFERSSVRDIVTKARVNQGRTLYAEYDRDPPQQIFVVFAKQRGDRRVAAHRIRNDLNGRIDSLAVIFE